MESTEDSMDASDCVQFGHEGLYEFQLYSFYLFLSIIFN